MQRYLPPDPRMSKGLLVLYREGVDCLKTRSSGACRRTGLFLGFEREERCFDKLSTDGLGEGRAVKRGLPQPSRACHMVGVGDGNGQRVGSICADNLCAR